MRQIVSRTSVLALLLLVLFSLGGCRYYLYKYLPFYEFHDDDYPSAVLEMDGVRYISDDDVLSMHSMYGSSEALKVWEFIGESDKPVGRGGTDPENAGMVICNVKGDDAGDFFYVSQYGFYCGPSYAFICYREDLQIEPASIQTISSASISFPLYPEDEEQSVSVPVDDPELIASFFEVYDSGVRQPYEELAGEGQASGQVAFYHKDFPLLQCAMECWYDPDENRIFCACRYTDDGTECLVLPEEWTALLSAYDIPAEAYE